MDSILTSVKKMLGITEEYEHFDPDLIMHINSVFMILYQLGVGPSKVFSINGDGETWADFIEGDGEPLNLVRSYMYLKVRLLFDPPQAGPAIESINRMIGEFEWRLKSEAELGKEAIVMLPVCRERFAPVPDTPVMDIADVLRIAVVEVSARGRRRRPVECIRVFRLHNLREYLFIHTDVVIHLLGRLRSVMDLEFRLGLIVPAPESHARMGAESSHLRADFRRDVGSERIAQLIGCAGKHEVLPDENSSLVADLIEIIIREITAAPDTDAVIMRLLRRLEKKIRALPGKSLENIILRDIISAHREDLKAIHLEGKVA